MGGCTPREARVSSRPSPNPACRIRVLRRGGRAVEGARLESVYTVLSRIEGSNPSPSAIIFKE